MMNTSFNVVRQYDPAGLPNFSMVEGERGSIQVVCTHSHPKRLNDIGSLSLEKTRELLNKIQQDLNYFNQLLDSPIDILLDTFKTDIIDDLRLGRSLYARCLSLLGISDIHSQFEKAPEAFSGEIETLPTEASLPTPINIDEVSSTLLLADNDGKETKSKSWNFDFRLDTPDLPPREGRGRKRKRPVAIFFPMKKMGEESEQQLPTPKTPPQIPPKPATFFQAQETIATIPAEPLFPMPQVSTQIISESQSSPIPTNLQPKVYSLSFPPSYLFTASKTFIILCFSFEFSTSQ